MQKKYDYMKPTAWAAYCSHGQPQPFINEYTIRARREDVMKEMADGAYDKNEDWRVGWRRLYKEGWRAIKVRIVPIKTVNG